MKYPFLQWGKIKNGSYVQHVLDATFLLAALGIHSKLNSLEAKENHLTDSSNKKTYSFQGNQ